MDPGQVQNVVQDEPQQPQAQQAVFQPQLMSGIKLQAFPKVIPKKKIEWEKPTVNYVNNYGPRTMYADFKYKNMNYEQLIEARKKAFIREQNDA